MKVKRATLSIFVHLKKQVVTRVAKLAVEKVQERNQPITAATVREAVDEDLCIKKNGKRKQQTTSIDLSTYLMHIGKEVELVMTQIDGLSVDQWEPPEESASRWRRSANTTGSIDVTCLRHWKLLLGLITRRPKKTGET